MSRTTSANNKDKQGLELFSDLMMMKFKPKSLEGSRKAKESLPVRRTLLGESGMKKSAAEQ
jgi:hypothetical protein